MKILLTLLAFALLFYSQAQTGNATVTYSGKLLFVNAIPTSEYSVVGKTKYSASKSNESLTIGDNTGMRKVSLAIDDAITKENKGKIEKFDAAIVYGPGNIELIKFNAPDPTKNGACNVNSKDYLKKKCGAKEIFFMIAPLKEYEVVATIEVSNFTNIGQLKMGKDDLDNFINKLYERSCKENKDGSVEFDAIVFYEKDMTISSGFLTGRSIQLIKYK